MKQQKNTQQKHDWSSIDLFYALKMARPGEISRKVLEAWRTSLMSCGNCYGIENLDLSKAGFCQTENRSYDARNPVCNLSGFGFGFEIETEFADSESRNKAIKLTSERFNKLMICKRDGSLNLGTEVVTPVFSHDILVKNSLELSAMSDLFALLTGCGAKVPRSTGGHIHFSDLRIVGKTRDFCLFVESLLQDAGELNQRCLFGRKISESQYATQVDSGLKGRDGSNFGRLKVVRDRFHKNELLTEKYMFIHAVSDSAGHIEFRLPAGTLNVQKLASRIHFLNACVGEFVRLEGRNWFDLENVFNRILKQIFKNVRGFKKYFDGKKTDLKGEEV